MKRIIILILTVIVAFSVYSQGYIQDGNRCFDSGDYVCAIKNYDNVFKTATGKDKQIVEIKLTRARWCAEHIKTANQAFANKNYKIAKENYQNVLDTNPRDAFAKQQIEICNKNLSTSNQNVAGSGNQTSNESNQPIKVTLLQFKNIDKNNNTLSNYGDNLYTNTKYIKPKIYYKSLSVISRNELLYIKITNPRGDILKGNTSPVGYSFSTELNIPVRSETTQTFELNSWGNDEGSVYKVSGTYKFEVWCNSKLLYSSEFYIKELVKQNANNKSSATSINSEGCFVTINSGSVIANIFIDSRYVGKLPFYGFLQYGTHNLQFEKDGKTIEKTITVREQSTDYFYFNLNELVDIKEKVASNVKYKIYNPTNLYLSIGILKPLVFKSDGETFANDELGYNFTIGIVKKIGVYSKINYNFPTIESGITPANLSNTYYAKSSTLSNSTYSRFGIVGGIMMNFDPVMLYLGAGKGYYNHFVSTALYNYSDDSYAKTIYLKTMSLNGIETDAGMIINLNKIKLSFGISSIQFKYNELNLGLGISF